MCGLTEYITVDIYLLTISALVEQCNKNITHVRNIRIFLEFSFNELLFTKSRTIIRPVLLFSVQRPA